MSTFDAPDWEKIVHVLSGTGVSSDAPDWERVVVAPGGGPVAAGVTFAGAGFADLPAASLSGDAQNPVGTVPELGVGSWLVGLSAILHDTSGTGNAAAYIGLQNSSGYTTGQLVNGATIWPAGGYVTVTGLSWVTVTAAGATPQPYISLLGPADLIAGDGSAGLGISSRLFTVQL